MKLTLTCTFFIYSDNCNRSRTWCVSFLTTIFYSCPLNQQQTDKLSFISNGKMMQGSVSSVKIRELQAIECKLMMCQQQINK